jgi:hypothetical protein
MKQRLLKGNALRPTRAYEVETGYVVKSRLRFTAMTLFQKIIFGVLIILFAAIIYGDGLSFDTIGGAVIILGAVGALFQILPLFLKVEFDAQKQQVKMRCGILDRATLPIESGSVFVFDNEDKIEYRQGQRGSVLGYGIQFSVNKEKAWDSAHVTALVAVLNEMLNLTRNATPLDPEAKEAVVEDYNPMD